MILDPTITSKKTINRFKTLESDFKKKYGDDYDYTMSCYSGVFVNIMVWCNEHNAFFWVKPNNHLKHGCSVCKRAVINQNQIDKAKATFKARCEKKHPNKYDYSLVWYRNNSTKVMIWCKTHLKFFWIKPADLVNGQGCKLCGNSRMREKRSRVARNEFIPRVNTKHPNLFGFDRVVYINCETHVELLCRKCDCYFSIRPMDVLSGTGHSGCADYGFNPSKPAILYYVRIETRNQIVYKIGITNRSVKERFSGSDWKIITVLDETFFEVGADAYNEEQVVLKEHKEFRYTGDQILESGGNTELFTKDVLGLDPEN